MRRKRPVSREHVLTVAEHLFSERGYAGVTLRDIASGIGIRQASLYHHFPGGKEQLFVEVMQRGLDRHHVGLTEAVERAGPELPARLRAAARWLLSQPLVDISRLVRSDLPAIAPEEAQRLTRRTLEALVVPIEDAFLTAQQRGEIALPQGLARPERLLTASFLSIIEGIQTSTRFTTTPPETLADAMIGVLLDGLRQRENHPPSPSA